MVVWELIRATGLLAYVLLSASVALGIGVRVRALDWLAKRAWTFELHQVISVLALAFTLVHAVLLLVNTHVRFGLADVLIPFASAWRPVATALGLFSLYLVALLTASSYLRPLIGQKTWRAIHYGGFAAWAMALTHGLSAGSDSGVALVQYLYLATGGIVAFLTIFRGLEATIGTPAAPQDRRHADSRHQRASSSGQPCVDRTARHGPDPSPRTGGGQPVIVPGDPVRCSAE